MRGKSLREKVWRVRARERDRINKREGEGERERMSGSERVRVKVEEKRKDWRLGGGRTRRVEGVNALRLKISAVMESPQKKRKIGTSPRSDQHQ